jgi:hypothetical protein
VRNFNQEEGTEAYEAVRCPSVIRANACRRLRLRSTKKKALHSRPDRFPKAILLNACYNVTDYRSIRA